MRKERQKRARRELDRRLKDKPRQHAGRGLSQCPPGQVFDLDPPAGKFGCDPPGDRGIRRDEGRGFAGRSTVSRIAIASAKPSSVSLSATMIVTP